MRGWTPWPPEEVATTDACGHHNIRRMRCAACAFWFYLGWFIVCGVSYARAADWGALFFYFGITLVFGDYWRWQVAGWLLLGAVGVAAHCFVVAMAGVVLCHFALFHTAAYYRTRNIRCPF